MKFSEEICLGLKRAASSTLVSDEALDKLLSEVSVFLENPLQKRIVDIPQNTTRIAVLKEVYAALVVFFVETIRRAEDLETIRQILDEFKFSDERVDKLIAVRQNYTSSLRRSLKLINSDPPHLFDVTWKLHYCVKSSYSDYDEKCLYLLEFTAAKPNRKGESCLEKITVACSVNHLQSLVSSLKAAVRQLEGVADLTSKNAD